MKDNNQSDNLLALIEAGVTSFKIEGRLKDLAYVKNITAHYRTLLDAIIDSHPQYHRAASGRSTFSFTPQPEKPSTGLHRLPCWWPPGRYRRLRLARLEWYRRRRSYGNRRRLDHDPQQ